MQVAGVHTDTVRPPISVPSKPRTASSASRGSAGKLNLLRSSDGSVDKAARASRVRVLLHDTEAGGDLRPKIPAVNAPANSMKPNPFARCV